MDNDKTRSIFLERIGETIADKTYAAAFAGAVVTLLAFFYISTLVSMYEAFNIYASIGLLLLYVILGLHFSGYAASKIPWVRERVQMLVATLYLCGHDDEDVDRNAITIRQMGTQRGLALVDYQEITDVPPEVAHLKHRVMVFKGSVRKMRAFHDEANEHLQKMGLPLGSFGDAVDEVEGGSE